MSDLIKCSKCRCNKLEKFFDIKETTGIRFKTCNKCRNKKVSCPQCNKVFKSNSNLAQHIKQVHLKIKDFVCPNDNCDFVCFSKSHIKRHIKHVHDKIKDFVCPNDNCAYKCASNGNLQKHIKQVHSNIKDYVCPYDNCDYKCSLNCVLTLHIKAVHDKVKDYVCPNDNCAYKCSSNGNLKRHIKAVHDKIKDYVCPNDNCDHRCTTKSHLKRHVRICTNGLTGSSGEIEIKKCLDKMIIYYEHNTSYKLKNSKDNYLRWDFIITYQNKKHFIEYDGRQHFEPVNFGGISKKRAMNNFEKQQTHDKLKNDFCKDNNYELLRIPYTEYGNIPQILTNFAVKHLDWGDE
jgi:uncharacterized C2H2 Zn-finger protein